MVGLPRVLSGEHPRRARSCLAVVLYFACLPALATNWYASNSAQGTHNGTSWANAWVLSQIVWGTGGVVAGDTLYLDGGSTGVVYNSPRMSIPVSGVAGNQVTVRVGQDAGHNGPVIFADVGSSTGNFVTITGQYVTLDGQYNGQRNWWMTNLWNTSNQIDASAVRITRDPCNGIDIRWLAVTNCNAVVLWQGSQNPWNGAGSNNRFHDCASRYIRGKCAFSTPGNGTSWDQNFVYNNVIGGYLDTSSWQGLDGYIVPNPGTTISNNVFTSDFGAGVHPGQGHADCIQVGSSQYVKVIANDFRVCPDSHVDKAAPAIHLWIVNNVFRNEDHTYPVPARHIRMYNGSGSTFSDVKILNNVFMDGGTVDSHGLTDTGAATDCVIANNIFVNSGGLSMQAVSSWNINTWSITNNLAYPGTISFSVPGYSGTFASWAGSHDSSTRIGLPSFASYSNGARNNDLHLQSGDTVAKGNGANYSSYFTTDKDGVARPASPTRWSLGPYEGAAGPSNTNLPPIVSAISQDAADVDPATPGLQVYEGTLVHYSGSASDPNSDPLSWRWSYSVDGGVDSVALTGTGTVLPVAFTYPSGSAGSSYLWKLRVSDGRATAQSQLTIGVESTPSQSGTLTFPAGSGSITAPFTLNNGSISQAIETALAGAGRATYTFNITDPGDYVIDAVVNAPAENQNSFFVNIDADPQDPLMIWDIIPVTAGFEVRRVSWRGNGNASADQFVPKTFTLAQGSHQLIILGREANTALNSLSLLKLPSPPTGLHVVSGM